MLGVAVGTGIGGGMVVDGRLRHGFAGTAGELGHTTVLPDGPRCGCGNRGCVEALAAGPALAREGGRATAAEVVEAAREGDARALAALARAGAFLGIAIGNAILLLSPERVVVGGGVAEAGDLLLEPVREEVLRRVHAAPVDRIPIVAAALGASAGAIGSALNVTGGTV
jgi:glucokinase